MSSGVTKSGRVFENEGITCHGTAFAISPRKLLTAAHNVLDDKGTRIQHVTIEYGDEWLPVCVTRVSAEADIAVLSIDRDIPCLDLGDDPREDTQVDLIGSPRGAKLAKQSGQVKCAYASGLRFLLSTKGFDHGCSGGPVLQAGKVAGMQVAGVPLHGDLDHDQCYFVPVSALRYFAEAAK